MEENSSFRCSGSRPTNWSRIFFCLSSLTQLPSVAVPTCFSFFSFRVGGPFGKRWVGFSVPTENFFPPPFFSFFSPSTVVSSGTPPFGSPPPVDQCSRPSQFRGIPPCVLTFLFAWMPSHPSFTVPNPGYPSLTFRLVSKPPSSVGKVAIVFFFRSVCSVLDCSPCRFDFARPRLCLRGRSGRGMSV